MPIISVWLRENLCKNNCFPLFSTFFSQFPTKNSFECLCLGSVTFLRKSLKISLHSALRWETAASQCPREQHKYDFILCADCLFFDESRSALVDSINYFLAEGGKALVMAPKRGKSMNLFIKKCMSSGLHCEIFTYYNKEVWDRHQKLRHSPLYNEDIHYPILIKLSRMKASWFIDFHFLLRENPGFWINDLFSFVIEIQFHVFCFPCLH